MYSNSTRQRAGSKLSLGRASQGQVPSAASSLREKNNPFHAVAWLPSHLCHFPDSNFSFSNQNCAWTRAAYICSKEWLFYMANSVTNPWICLIFVNLFLGVSKVYFLPITSAMVSFLSTSFSSLYLSQFPTLFLNYDHLYHYLSLLLPLVS